MPGGQIYWEFRDVARLVVHGGYYTNRLSHFAIDREESWLEFLTKLYPDLPHPDALVSWAADPNRKRIQRGDLLPECCIDQAIARFRSARFEELQLS